MATRSKDKKQTVIFYFASNYLTRTISAGMWKVGRALITFKEKNNEFNVL